MREQGSAAERGGLMNKQSSRPCSSEDCQQELRRRHDKHTRLKAKAMPFLPAEFRDDFDKAHWPSHNTANGRNER